MAQLHPVVIHPPVVNLPFVNRIRKAPVISPKAMGYFPNPAADKFDIPQLPAPLMGKDAELSAKRILMYSGPTLDQNGWPACVGFAFTSNQMRDEKLEHGVFYFNNADALQLYNDCKAIDGYPGDGTFGGAAVQVLADKGVRSSGRWILTAPGAWNTAIWKAWDQPRWYKIKASQAVGWTPQDICAHIDMERRPVLIGMNVDDQIYDPPATGILPAPNHRIIGGHEMEIYGYDLNKTVDGTNYGLCFAVKNSWGGWWGGGSGLSSGRVWMPESWLSTYDHDLFVTTDVRPD